MMPRASLEIMSDGYGFLRRDNYLPGTNDVYVSNSQIRRFRLRTGDLVTGKTRQTRENNRYVALMYITAINGISPEEAALRSLLRISFLSSRTSASPF